MIFSEFNFYIDSSKKETRKQHINIIKLDRLKLFSEKAYVLKLK